jgi:hypothetical protein
MNWNRRIPAPPNALLSSVADVMVPTKTTSPSASEHGGPAGRRQEHDHAGEARTNCMSAARTQMKNSDVGALLPNPTQR